jgi:hypothetical protein
MLTPCFCSGGWGLRFSLRSSRVTVEEYSRQEVGFGSMGESSVVQYVPIREYTKMEHARSLMVIRLSVTFVVNVVTAFLNIGRKKLHVKV